MSKNKIFTFCAFGLVALFAAFYFWANFIPAAAQSSCSYAAGDANQDGNITSADINAIKSFLADPSTATCSADCNQDGAVNVSDYVCVRNKIGCAFSAGDANQDGSINVQDISYASLLVASSSDYICSADCNGDGLVNSTDYVCIRNKIVGCSYAAGDANQDGNITSADINAIKSFLADPSSATCSADCNADGAVNSTDYICVRNKIGCAFSAGDANQDGSITPADYNAIKSVMADSSLEKCSTDCNGDGEINSTDFICVRNKIGCSYTAGDANQDGNVNVQDMSAISNIYYSGGDYICSADCNLDGQISASDITCVRNKIASSTPIVISDFTGGATGSNSASLYWTTNIEAQCVVAYNENSAVSGTAIEKNGTLVQSASPSNDGKFHYYASLQNLKTTTKYYYKVTCSLSYPNSAVSSSIQNFTTLTDTGITSRNLKATPLSDKSINIRWDTDYQEAVIFYYKNNDQENYITANCYAKAFSTDRECQVVLNMLIPGAIYQYKFKEGNVLQPSYASYFVMPTKLDPSAVKVTDITNSSATVTWTTDKDLNSQVMYNPVNNIFDQKTEVNSDYQKSHSIKLSGLNSATKYTYRITSQDQEGGGKISEWLFFETKQSASSTMADFIVTDLGVGYFENSGNPGYYLFARVKNIGGNIEGAECLMNKFQGFESESGMEDGYAAKLCVGQSNSSQMYLMNGSWLVMGPSTNGMKEKTYKLKFTTDSTSIYAESNETNNTLERTINIKKEVKNTDRQIQAINNNANRLYHERIEEILTELKIIRDEMKEQSIKIKYLERIYYKLEKISNQMQNALNNFIAYGADENTSELGAGERAAVIYSYNNAFNKLPETEQELADVIKIANGRYPAITNELAEKQAKERFVEIFKRVPDMNNAKDAAAVKVMAYGLRQKAENRNLESERKGIGIYRSIFKKQPSSTEEWNMMQAITYSGAVRQTDTDGDLLSDEMEKINGTDIKKADTDGDGFKDGIEILNGYNPKGSGK